MSYYDVIAFGLRLSAAIVWSTVFMRIVRGNLPTSFVVRLLFAGGPVVVLWAVVFGGAATLGMVEPGLARVVYTAVSTAVLIAGLVLVTVSFSSDDE